MSSDDDKHFAEAFRSCWFWGIVAGIFAILALGLALSGAHARDLDNRYANSPLKPWFDHLASQRGLCCSMADGETVSDPDWESKDGHYRVRLEGAWIDVPDDAVITEPNLSGHTMVWPVRKQGWPYHPPVIEIRCFMPGSMT
jgi:hypothetical protein